VGIIDIAEARYEDDLKQVIDKFNDNFRQLLHLINYKNVGADNINVKNLTVNKFELKDAKGNTVLLGNENGITLSGGATIAGASGVLSVFSFISSGEYNGWQKAGWWTNGSFNENWEAFIFADIPANFEIDTATLITKSMPRYFFDGTANNPYQIKQAKLYHITDALAGMLDYPASTPEKVIYSVASHTDVTTSKWGGVWTPTPALWTIETKSADVKSLLTPGQRVAFSVDSGLADDGTQKNASLIQFELTITGYQKK